MFGVEPLEPASEEEILEFELYAAAQLKRRSIDAAWAAVVFAVVVICIIPFSAGHPWNRYWSTARYLVWVAMALWAWLVYKLALIWAEWQSARETRREIQ